MTHKFEGDKIRARRQCTVLRTDQKIMPELSIHHYSALADRNLAGVSWSYAIAA